ncbi:MAG TPA: zf-HC2 domain-containing protein [Pyrinomonadaceae bacterium]|jgi:hypothetical protein
MSCECTEKISQLIDGELPEIEARTMQRHLNECSECQQAREDFLSFRSQIANYIPAISPIAQAEGLVRIVGRQDRIAPGITSGKPRFAWNFSFGMAAFATMFVLAALVGFIVYKATQNNTTAPAQLAKTNPVPASEPSPKPSPSDAGTRQKDRQAPPNKPAQPKSSTPSIPRRTPRDSENFAANRIKPGSNINSVNESVRAADMQALTALHLEKSELLLRAFRNIRTGETESAEIAYERKQAQQLIVRNMMLRREADNSGDVQVASLLENLEPILLDIANLPDDAAPDDIRVINERVERKNIVALLQVNSTVLARAMDDD